MRNPIAILSKQTTNSSLKLVQLLWNLLDILIDFIDRKQIRDFENLITGSKRHGLHNKDLSAIHHCIVRRLLLSVIPEHSPFVINKLTGVQLLCYIELEVSDNDKI